LGEYWDRLDNKYLVWIKLMLKKEGIIWLIRSILKDLLIIYI
jgi:hypothetical protein